MKKILFNKIILSIFFFIAGSAIAWTQGQPKNTVNYTWNPPPSPWIIKTTVKNVTGLQHREDDQYVYYDLHLNQNGNQKMDVKVSDGQVIITGSSERKERTENFESFVGSSFQDSFPVPDYVDEQSFVTEHQGNKLTIKFKKIQQT